MGIAYGGETAKALREQASRISACSLQFFWDDDRQDGWAAARIVNSGLRFQAADTAAQAALWEERVVLDEVFYKSLRDHPVPLQEAAIRELRDRSMSLDLYVWLAWRLAYPEQADTDIMARHTQPVRLRISGDPPLSPTLSRRLGCCRGRLSGSQGAGRGRRHRAASITPADRPADRDGTNR